METDVLRKKMTRNSDLHHVIQMRAKEIDENNKKMILEGKAVTFDEETVLFEWDGVEYKEEICSGSFDETDMSKCFLKFNHSDTVMPMARVKNKTLKIDVRDDGVYIEAELANTQAGRDLYELVKRGDIDQMSFAFKSEEESYNEETHTWKVRKVGVLYDVAAVNLPAYENTELHARRVGDVETRKREVEASKLEQKRSEAGFWLKLVEKEI